MKKREALDLIETLGEENRLGALLLAGLGPLIHEFEDLGYAERWREVQDCGDTLILLTRAGVLLSESFDRKLPRARRGR